ncbi:MAG: periplasmic heavy metal sensor [Patescibacteria group bacterium]|nr:periplasmic heavy metal sensor [Patescibacteria group bacterium]
MWKTASPYLLIASVALNVAFAAMWLAYAATPSAVAEPMPPDRSGVWCPLHRQLEVTGQQWSVIEPRLLAFQESAGQLRNEVAAMRAEVIDLLAAETPDLDAIRAKQDDVVALRRTMQARVVEHLLAEKATLTPEQQARFFEILRERAACGEPGPPMSGKGWLGGECGGLDARRRERRTP